MRRFFLFAYDHYYPGGGLSDVVGSYDTAEEAIAAFVEAGSHHEEAYVLDLQERRLVHGRPPSRYDLKTKPYDLTL